MNAEQLEIAKKIDRCLEIEKEFDSLNSPRLSNEDIECVSDKYQEALELSYYRQELKDEYEQLNKELGYMNRKLYPKELRRTGM